MKNTIALAKPLALKIKKNRDALAAALPDLVKAEDNAESQEAQVESLQKAIDKLEATDNLTDAAISQLAIKREKLRLFTKRIESNQDPGGTERDRLNTILRQSRSLLHDAMLPIHQALEKEILAALAPYYISLHLSPQLAAGSDAAMSLANFSSVQWGFGLGNTAGQAKSAIAIFDSLLAGKNPWKFKKS